MTKKMDGIKALPEQHEVVSILEELIHKDGAGSWPPRANHTDSTWPVALRSYKEIYQELVLLLPTATPSLNDQVNTTRIANFRLRFRDLLYKRVNLAQVKQLLEAADADRWDVFPRDVYNAFYCCIASSRHAYRWATIPVVQVAQLEKEVDLPIELTEPWKYLQRHFGCTSESGNNMSNLVLNFDTEGRYMYKINTGMYDLVTSSEETFARIFYNVEMLGVPVYHDMVLAIVTFARGEKAACARHVANITAQLRLVLGSYFDHMHDQKIARSVWLSHIQGFFAWGIGSYDDASGECIKFDGLSGNQALLFQALDAFLGIEQYLSPRDQERNVPARQRALCRALAKYSFRQMLSETSNDKNEAQIVHDFGEIVKRLRVFRAAHRTRARVYLSQHAPERLPMTAGKSLLEPNIDQSLQFLDEFMVRRLSQTV
ncbi:uncharacterized protein K460DRAFT_410277 [Cucurbitaria berberidis CBS 394.84]|uniref:Indoleamine 2,3-dioxygenase n=1 Tax=Cucurbitaria berberidis CBS 394.84 TaxID=1168544 RepID=A0A9P4G8K0_9PLEO|nr:uncharacterized protein K460DRAFT_410277 [Cucurbitaria berberidis CBS 394.84]KAF1840882.1 hypothetical protein K460DRAFT_410277 [Cucurbitaria berberidis CBS 394.84]